jgi:hypothetical protein
MKSANLKTTALDEIITSYDSLPPANMRSMPGDIAGHQLTNVATS